MRELVVRADASAEIGIGHVMRCLAFGEAWQRAGGDVTLITAAATPTIERLAAARGFAVRHTSAEPGSAEDVRQLILSLQAGPPSVVAVDGYAFDYQYHLAIKRAGLKLLCVDDYGHAGHYCADIVLNQNPWATEAVYRSREPQTSLLLGSRYTLLRGEFLMRQVPQREIKVARRLLVTFGGGDVHNTTANIIQAITELEMPGVETLVVAGPSNPHKETLHRTIKESGRRIQLIEDTESMPALMEWADLAIAAAGSTCWEFAFMGLPAAVVVTAENQRPCARLLHEKGIAHNLGTSQALDPDLVSETVRRLMQSPEALQDMSRRGRALVDGRGAERAATIFGECVSAD